MAEKGVKEPRMLGSKEAHALIRSLISSVEPGKVLEAATGYGSLAAFLNDRGFDVHCCDIDPGLYEGPDLPMKPADLNRPLPYDDCSFDYVTCANAIQRLYNVDGVFREFARVLKPGGRLFVTFNNYSNISKRLRFLFYGSLTSKTNEGRYVQTIDDPEANLRQALFFPQVGRALEQAGLKLEGLYHSRIRASGWLLLPLALFIRLSTTLLPMYKKESNMVTRMNSWPILPGGKYIGFVAVRKDGAPQASEQAD